jgi:hypothetical protein
VNVKSDGTYHSHLLERASLKRKRCSHVINTKTPLLHSSFALRVFFLIFFIGGYLKVNYTTNDTVEFNGDLTEAYKLNRNYLSKMRSTRCKRSFEMCDKIDSTKEMKVLLEYARGPNT